MRVCVAAGILLLVIVALVVGNALYVHRVSDDLLARAHALPAVPDPASTPAAVAALRERLERHLPWLGLSVHYGVLDRVEEALYALEAQAATGDSWQYAASRAVLIDLLRDIERLERLGVENIF